MLKEYTWGGKLTYRRYYQMIAFIWVWALFWSVCPLLGWASYGYEPSVTTCTINWQQNDTSYKWYIMTVTVLVYFVPLCLMCSCYYQAAKFLHRAHETGDAVYSYDWASERNVTKMGGVLVLTYLFCWSAYAVVCVWTVFPAPVHCPSGPYIAAALMAKRASESSNSPVRIPF
ncbi:peropsin [Penaeus vannamei]|uniref:Peropsin n=1 Tax=Penaeus vannamei TaxID=6689 RepID=A0A3R7PFG0_PENVA|nr:peropsin [Penaeus vannamei]